MGEVRRDRSEWSLAGREDVRRPAPGNLSVVRGSPDLKVVRGSPDLKVVRGSSDPAHLFGLDSRCARVS